MVVSHKLTLREREKKASCIRIQGVGHHLLDSLEICQTNSIDVYIGTYCLEMNVYVGKLGEKERIFFLSNGCVGVHCITLYVSLTC